MSDLIREKVTPFAGAFNFYAAFDTGVSVLGYALTVSASYYFLAHGLWLGFAVLTVLGSLFMIKIFTIQHDCGHGSMFSSELANTWVGRLCSLITTMPYDAWKRNHHAHHMSVGNLSKAGIGDTALMTVSEFKNASLSARLGYKAVRNPFVHLVVSPFFYFFILFKVLHVFGREYRVSTLLNDLSALAVFITLAYFFGFWLVLFTYVPTLYFGGIVGLTLFYLQHNFPKMQWFKTEVWEHGQASFQSSSLIILPQPLEWFTHAIGYHHIHHLHSKIPGYRLRAVFNSIPEVKVELLTLRDVVRSFQLKLWSHELGKLVTYKEAEALTH